MLAPEQVAPVRKRLGLTQSELAKRSRVSQSLVAKIEAGLLDPSYSKLKAISDALEGAGPGRGARTVEEVMHREVIAMYATDPIERAVEYMARHGVSQLPVLDMGVLVGTVTESSLLHHLTRDGDDRQAMQRPVREVMTAPLPQVPPETHVDAVLPLLEAFPAVLVAANGRVQGIVTKSDLLLSARGPRPERKEPLASPT